MTPHRERYERHLLQEIRKATMRGDTRHVARLQLERLANAIADFHLDYAGHGRLPRPTAQPMKESA